MQMNKPIDITTFKFQFFLDDEMEKLKKHRRYSEIYYNEKNMINIKRKRIMSKIQQSCENISLNKKNGF